MAPTKKLTHHTLSGHIIQLTEYSFRNKGFLRYKRPKKYYLAANVTSEGPAFHWLPLSHKTSIFMKLSHAIKIAAVLFADNKFVSIVPAMEVIYQSEKNTHNEL